MGYIKEPDGVDFIVKSAPLTDTERKEISQYIMASKELAKETPIMPRPKSTKKV